MSERNILYFDEASGSLKELLQELKPSAAELIFFADLKVSDKERALAEADFFLAATAPVGRKEIEQASQLRLIQKTGTGVDNIDLQAARDFAVPVANTPGVNAGAVAELTLSFILALYRKLPVINRETKAGSWPMWRHRTSSFELQGKTHGFIGFGNVGRRVAELSSAFGTNIIYYDVLRVPDKEEERLNASYAALESVLEQADIISMHIPLLQETKHLIGAPELRRMKNNALLINVSRGGVVDEKALYEALTEKEIAGAAIDVWENEPVREDHPLLGLDQVIASAHIGAGTYDTLRKVLTTAFENIEKMAMEKDASFLIS
ncbi:2-hydroxyacid dehydrogenase [Alteribacillus sp. HJP-4]|uniref:2-hydroxyacid dehydrogenase n=1 Tax=Alteribacillus sp. HJP-4 TaxID=2775394 RepID=UPI0035CD308C